MKYMILGATVLGVFLVLVTPRVASSQESGTGIAGMVRDATGAVLPGVTVEAASPALLEKSRTVISDGGGQYKLVGLRPGTYTVTFTLAGFSSLKREGIELTSGFTATVNADLRVGEVAESLTVTGATPLVDTQSTHKKEVLTSERMEALPVSKSMSSFGALTAGVTTGPGQGLPVQDVGGNLAEVDAFLMIHNSRGNDAKQSIDGMAVLWSYNQAGGSAKLFYPDPAATQEVVLDVSGISAEIETAGVQVNHVPKDGGNTLRGIGIANFTNHSLQGTNTEDLASRGVLTQAKTKRVYDLNMGMGGPIMKDKLWFYGSGRTQRSDIFVPGNYFNATLHTLFYTPDLNQPAYFYNERSDVTGRVTWQATSKQKFSFFEQYGRNCQCYQFTYNGFSPEASFNYHGVPLYYTQGTWSYPVTNRLLIQAGITYSWQTGRDDRPVEGTEHDIGIIDAGTGKVYGSFPGLNGVSPGFADAPFLTSRASASYVTGAHNFKVGFHNYYGYQSGVNTVNSYPGQGTVQYVFVNQKPLLVNYYASPFVGKSVGNNIGLYAQDQWTLNRLTVNAGLRFDYQAQWVPAQGKPASDFTPALVFAKIDVSSLKDINPRLGVAYDLFGNGKTAVKFSVNRYILGDAVGLALANNPNNSVVLTASRSWNDNGDYLPQEAELGPLSNSAFGTVAINTHYDPAILKGWGARPYNWETSVTLAQQLGPRMGLQAGYFRRTFGNLYVTDNTLIGPGDYDPYCVTAPLDAGLPGGGGNQICDYYDLDPAAVGKVSNFVTSADNFGGRSEVFNGVDVAVNARFGQGGAFTAGVSTGQTVWDDCLVVDNPAGIPGTPNFTVPGNSPRRDCKKTLAWGDQFQLKMNGVYPLPGKFMLSGVFQNVPGAPYLATYAASNASIKPSLGRDLSGGAATAQVQLISPNSAFENRLTQVDARLTRVFQFGRTRLQPQFDLYNIFNGNSVLGQVNTYGARWRFANTIMGARTFKFGAQLDF